MNCNVLELVEKPLAGICSFGIWLSVLDDCGFVPLAQTAACFESGVGHGPDGSHTDLQLREGGGAKSDFNVTVVLLRLQSCRQDYNFVAITVSAHPDMRARQRLKTKIQ